jgi:hypothetical protein
MARLQSMTSENIRRALEPVVGADEPLNSVLAAVLDGCRGQDSIAFEEIAALAPEDAPEIILLAWEWKLLIPRRSRQSAEWDDRIMRLEAGERFEMVNIVKSLLALAAEGGNWNLAAAVRSLYGQMGEPAFERMPSLILEMARRAKYQSISGAAIHGACARTGFQDRTGAMIAILKGGGVISPRLMSSRPSERIGSPLYEMHPLVLKLSAKEPNAP